MFEAPSEPGRVPPELPLEPELPEPAVLPKKIEKAIAKKTFYLDKDFDALSPAQHRLIAERLFDDKSQRSTFLYSIDRFKGLDHNVFMRKLLSEMRGQPPSMDISHVISELHHLSNDVAFELVQAGYGYAVMIYLSRFDGIDVRRLMAMILESDHADTLAREFKGLKAIDPTIDAGEVAKAIVKKGHGYSILHHLDQYDGVDAKDVALQMIESGQGESVGNSIEKIPEIDRKDIALRLIEDGQGDYLVRHLDVIHGLDRAAGEKLFVSCLQHSRPGLAELVRYKFLEGKTPPELVPPESRAAYGATALRFLEEKRSVEAFQLHELVPLADPLLVRAFESHGPFLTSELFKEYKSIVAGEVSKDAAALGVKHGGDAGLIELQRGVEAFKHEMVYGQVSEDFLESPIRRQLFKQLVRFEGSAWGKHDDETFQATARRFFELREAERSSQPGSIGRFLRKLVGREKRSFADVDPVFRPSGTLRVAEIDREAEAAWKHDEGFLKRWADVLSDIRAAKDLANPEVTAGLGGLRALVERFNEVCTQALADLQGRLDKATNPKAQEAFTRQIADLEAIDARSLASSQEAFAKLRTLKGGPFESFLRQAVFFHAFRKHPGELARELPADMAHATSGDIASVTEFVDHIVNQETFAEYFTDTKAAKEFKSLVNVSAFEQELGRMRSIGTKGTVSLEFVPTRGLLTEFSGHIADACWASKYDSISKEFPNFTCLLIVQNPGTNSERLAGSMMLIDSKTEKGGQPVMIVRGDNPIENLINRLDPKAYLDAPAREPREQKVLVVKGEASGQSGTNRPALFAEYERRFAKQSPVRVSGTDTKFNSYDITDQCYELA